MTTGVLVAVGAVDFESAVLTAASGADLHVVRRCVDVPDMVATAATGQASVALVSTGLGGLDTEVVDRLHEDEVLVVGVVADEQSDDARVLRQLGADLVVAVAGLATLPGLLEQSSRQGHTGASAEPLLRAATARSNGAAPQRDGRILAVWGPTGAPGRSVVSLGVASMLASSGVDTMVIDADVYGGAQAQLLGLLDEASGLLAAARAANRGRLDASQLSASARSVSSGLRVLSGLPRSDRWVELSPVLLRRILDTARSVTAVTVVDCAFCVELDEEISYDVSAPRRNGATLAALQSADRVLVVGSADPLGLGRLIRAVSDLRVLAPDAEPFVVVNRMRPSLGWSADDVAAMLRRTCQVPVGAFLPDDPVACDRAMVQGRTLAESAPGSRLAKALHRLSSHLVDTAVGVSGVAS